MKAKLREVDFVFHVPVGSDARDWRQVTLQVGLLHGEMNITFSISGVEDRETIPASVLDGIQEAVAWAHKTVRARDLSEMDAEDRGNE